MPKILSSTQENPSRPLCESAMADKYNRDLYQDIISQVKTAVESENDIDESSLYADVFKISQIYRYNDDWTQFDDLEQKLSGLMAQLQAKLVKNGQPTGKSIADTSTGISDANKEKANQAVGQVLDYASLIPVEAFTEEERAAKTGSFDKQVVVFLRYLQ